MAWIRERPRKNGMTYTVTWREPGAQAESTLAFREKAEAEQTVRLLDANNQSFAAADRVLTSAKADGPTVHAMILDHIALLTGVGSYQIQRYKSAAATHFSGSLGSLRVKSLRHDDISRWIHRMEAKGLAPKTIANHHGLLSGAMTTATRMGIRADNPCKGVRLPKSTHTGETMHVLSKDAYSALRDGTDPHFRPFLALLVGTGLRFSEAGALTASDFIMEDGLMAVRVTKAWKQNGEGGYYIGPPKTRKSTRTVSLAAATVEAITPALERCGTGLVFTLKRGGAMRSGSAHNRMWTPALRAAGYGPGDRPRIHDLRHTHASWMIGAGMEVFALSRRLGHESITTTMDRYSHLLPDAHIVGAQVAAKALEGL